MPFGSNGKKARPVVYAFTYEVPIDSATYEAITAALGDEAAPGFIAHIAHRTESGLRYLDVWNSEADFTAFEKDRLHPAVHGVLSEKLGFVPPEPPKTVLDVVHVWTTAVNQKS
jgi:heme-degrading monooxygenase HmoA